MLSIWFNRGLGCLVFISGSVIRGAEYEIVRFCKHVKKYDAVKLKCEVSLVSNHKKLFSECG
jgi:hypothetical protein